MNDLIKALQIFAKYGDIAERYAPTGCDHDILRVYLDPTLVSADDLAEVERLGFHIDTEIGDCFGSFRFGSA